MPLTPGQRLGPYEIVSAAGVGGMGEVYRARDTRLDRTVAIKVLPAHVADNPQRRQRFEREARAISSLTHPNICALYDVGHQEGVDFLVLEYLEGETLAERLEKGALPTQSRPLTDEGTIVGTFQYMAPEQLEGKDADARTDIFALGAVLHEMATGRKAFEGKSQASLIAAILAAEPPPISRFQPMTPPALDRVVKTCLAKDPDERWQTAHDLRLQLQWIVEAGSQAGVPAPVVARRKVRERLAWALAALAVLAAVGASLGVGHYARQARESSRVVRSSLLAPENASFSIYVPLGVSPDGRRLAFVAQGADGKSLIWVRALDSLTAQPLVGTEGAGQLFWSPDSRFIGFVAEGKLKKIDATGGPALTLCEATVMRGATWSREGVILFAPTGFVPIYRVSAAGGAPIPVTKLDESRRENSHRWPYFLPDGRHFLFLARTAGAPENNGVYVGSLDGKPPQRLLADDSSAAYSPPGYLLFIRQGTLMAQPFDAKKLELTGEAVPVAEQVQFNAATKRGVFSVSDNGVLAYLGGAFAGGGSGLLWFDRNGKPTGTLGEPGLYFHPRLSPDGRRAVVGVLDPQAGNADLWIYEVARGIRTRFTFDPGTDWLPVWSPDGSRIAFASNRRGQYDIYQKAASGATAEEALLETEADEYPSSWSLDGRFLAYTYRTRERKTKWDIWILPLFGERKPFPFLQTEFNEWEPQFSPDGRWLAYVSDESGQDQVYLMPFPGPGGLPAQAGKWQVSPAGGRQPQWRRDGKELFYLALDDKLMAVEVKPLGSTVEIGVPRLVLQTRPIPPPGRHYEAAAGQRFLVVTPREASSATPLTLVVNWPAELKK